MEGLSGQQPTQKGKTAGSSNPSRWSGNIQGNNKKEDRMARAKGATKGKTVNNAKSARKTKPKAGGRGSKGKPAR
jgi:hypothetical protein